MLYKCNVMGEQARLGITYFTKRGFLSCPLSTLKIKSLISYYITNPLDKFT